MHQPATAVGGAKGCQPIEGAARKGNKFALALTERPRQHPAPQPPNRVRAKGAQRVRKYDRCRKLPTSTIKSPTRSIQSPFCTGQKLKEKHNLPHLYRPEAKREADSIISAQAKLPQKKQQLSTPTQLRGKIQKGGLPPFWSLGRGIPKGEANRNASPFGVSLVTFCTSRK